MVIYADILVAINFAIDFLIIKAASLFCGKSPKNLRLVLAAAVGALSSLIIFFDMQGRAATAFYRIACALAMSAAAFWPCKIKTLMKSSFAIYVQSFIVSGTIMLWKTASAPVGVMCLGGAVYFDISVPALILSAVLGYTVACALSTILSQKLSSEQFCDITVAENGVSVTFTALIDTGNSLIEPFSGYPVIVCEMSALRGAVPDDVANFDFERLESTKIRLVPYRTMDSSGLLPSFFPSQLMVNGQRTDNCCIAVTTARLGEQYRAICNPRALINNDKMGDEAYEVNG